MAIKFSNLHLLDKLIDRIAEIKSFEEVELSDLDGHILKGIRIVQLNTKIDEIREIQEIEGIEMNIQIARIKQNASRQLKRLNKVKRLKDFQRAKRLQRLEQF